MQNIMKIFWAMFVLTVLMTKNDQKIKKNVRENNKNVKKI